MKKIQALKEFKLPQGFRGRSSFVVQFWWIVQSTLFGCSPQFMYGWRRFLLRAFGAKIGKNVIIRPSARVTYPWKLSVGDDSWIGDDVVLYTLGTIDIGNDVVISQRSYLCTGSHDYSKRAFDIYQKPIYILPESWLATDVFVAPGVTIGRGAVVGARSTVLFDVPEDTISVGTPAKIVGTR